jgi:hypothetical protein
MKELSYMQDFRSGHYAKDERGNTRLDYTPMREDVKDDYTVDLARGFLNSYIGLPLMGAMLMGISYLDKNALDEMISMVMRYGNHVSKETILALYGIFSAAPLVLGASALYKGTLNLGQKMFGSK